MSDDDGGGGGGGSGAGPDEPGRDYVAILLALLQTSAALSVFGALSIVVYYLRHERQRHFALRLVVWLSLTNVGTSVGFFLPSQTNPTLCVASASIIVRAQCVAFVASQLLTSCVCVRVYATDVFLRVVLSVELLPGRQPVLVDVWQAVPRRAAGAVVPGRVHPCAHRLHDPAARARPVYHNLSRRRRRVRRLPQPAPPTCPSGCTAGLCRWVGWAGPLTQVLVPRAVQLGPRGVF
jgi:hypothetical protein